jgi:aldose 1-epimerase
MRNRVVTFALAALNLSAPDAAQSAEVTRMNFGELVGGTRVEAFVLSNAAGASATIITLGATIQSLSVPDRNGKSADIVLGYRTADEYLDNPQYFGATVGRYANRIAEGRFTLDGKEHTLPRNDGKNHLHGGPQGLDKALWKVESVSNGSPASVTLAHTSPDGEAGYPGTLNITATYALSDRNELSVEYRATTDQPTIVNITNHAYFNLAGEAGHVDVMDHRLTLVADRYTPVDETLIPTGELREVTGTPFDFREERPIGLRIRDGSDEQIRFGRGYDHNFVVNGADGALRNGARVEDPRSGRVMEVLVTAPGVQFYSGNFLDGTTVGKSGRVYRQGDAFCLEPQVFPDSPNKPDFPSARLDPGDTYVNRVVFRFSTVGR